MENPQLITRLLAIAAFAISAGALFVSSRQLTVNREKIRLDLYDRRFAVYLRTLDFHQTLAGPQEFFLTEAFTTIHKEFIKATRESQYLFEDDSGIHKLLERLHVEAFKIKAVKENGRKLEGELFTRMFEQSMAALTIFNEAIPDLEQKLKPYLNFQKVLL